MNINETRVAHKLRGPQSTTQPVRLAFLDTETRWTQQRLPDERQTHTFRLAVLISGEYRRGKFTRERVSHHTSSLELWTEIADMCNSKSPLYLFAHNAGFDLTVSGFWTLVECGGLEVFSNDFQLRDLKGDKAKDVWKGLLVMNDPPTIIHARDPVSKGEIRIIDTLNYWRKPLVQLGLDFGLPKLDMPDIKLPDESWFVYCENDARIIQRAVVALLDFQRVHDLGTFRPTAPGMAWSAWNRRFRVHDVFIHGCKAALETERDACFGGRVECFRHGQVDEPVTHLDVNSLYPSVMRGNQYPTKLVDYLPILDPDVAVDMLAGHCLVADCQLSTCRNQYPVRDDKLVYYPTGDYWTALTGPEIMQAYEDGELISLRNVYVYQCAPIFDTWVDFFYDLRLQFREAGNKSMEELCKLFLNSLNGKFAQRSYRWDWEPDTPAIMPWGQWCRLLKGDALPTMYRAIHWKTQRQGIPGEGADSFPAIYAHVTAYGRAAMQHLMALAGRGNVYYTDTDSLHVNQAGLTALQQHGSIDRERLGALKVVGEGAFARYYGLKDYVLGDTQVLGQLSRKAVQLSDREYLQWVFPRLPAILSSRPRDRIEVVRRKIALSNRHIRGTCHDNGIVSPWCIREDYSDYRFRMGVQTLGRPGGSAERAYQDARSAYDGPVS